MSARQRRQQKMEENELLARAQALAGTTAPVELAVKVDYKHTHSSLDVTLPEHLGGLKETATLSGRFSLLFTFGKHRDIATVSLVESDEKISSIPFIYDGAHTKSGAIVHGLDDFDRQATCGTANFRTGEFQMTYVLSPRVPFLSERGMLLPSATAQMVNEERGRINPTTFAFRSHGRIWIESGPFSGTLVECREGGNGEDEPHEPTCHWGEVRVPQTVTHCGEYHGTEDRDWPICGDGICNFSDDKTVTIILGTKKIVLPPKTCSDALNGVSINGNWYVAVEAPGMPCSDFPPSWGVTVFMEF